MKYHIELDLDFKRNPYKGKFFAIEGIDGSGKTIQSKLLAENLTKRKKTVGGYNPSWDNVVYGDNSNTNSNDFSGRWMVYKGLGSELNTDDFSNWELVEI